MELLVVVAAIYAIKNLIEDTRKAWRTSKTSYMRSADRRFPGMPAPRRAAHAARHDIGYWAGQSLRGFPASRHGLAAGWHAGRQAQAEGRIAREQAKTEHLEARAGLAPQIREFRARQKAALEQIRTGSRIVPGNDAEGRCVHCGAPDGQVCDPDCRTNGGTLSQGEGRESGREGNPAAPQGTRRVDGKPETDADRRFFDLRESGYKGAIDQDGNIPADAFVPVVPADPHEACNAPGCGCGCHGTSAEPEAAGMAALQPAGTQTTTEGTTSMPVAADTSYDGVLASMTAAKAQAETTSVEAATASKQAEARATEAASASRQAAALSDSMQALEVDSGTNSAMMDHLDAHSDAAKAELAVQEATVAAEKAHKRVFETAGSVESTLKRGHAGLNEAHQNAPVEAAKKEFYAG